MQYELPLICVLNGPKRVPDDVVNAWTCPHDAITWAFEHRTNASVKTKVWFAQHIQIRTQHITRILKNRDLKLDNVQAHMWDCLTGWTACDQFKEAEAKRIAQRAAAQLADAIQMRAA